MPWNGAGSYSPPGASFPETNGTIIDATRFDATVTDLAAGITASLAKNGENTATANLPMGGNRHTGAGGATTAGMYLVYGQSAMGTLDPALITAALGAVATPSYTFNGDLNTGMWSPGADTLAWSVNGLEALRINNARQILSGTLGILGSPAYSFAADLNTGMWSPSADTLAWSVNGVEAMRITAAANIGIGQSPSYRFDVSDTGGVSATVNVARVFANASANASARLLFGTPANLTNASFLGFTASATGGRMSIETAQETTGSLTARFVADEFGRLYATGIHNNAQAATGTVNQYFASGSYTPTISATLNVSASAVVSTFKWIRLGNVVHVAGQVNITPTAAAPTVTNYSLSLPIGSTLASNADLSGTTASMAGTTQMAGIVQAGGNIAAVTFAASVAGINRHAVVFSYEVL